MSDQPSDPNSYQYVKSFDIIKGDGFNILDIAVDSSNSIYILKSPNAAINKFDIKGELMYNIEPNGFYRIHPIYFKGMATDHNDGLNVLGYSYGLKHPN